MQTSQTMMDLAAIHLMAQPDESWMRLFEYPLSQMNHQFEVWTIRRSSAQTVPVDLPTPQPMDLKISTTIRQKLF